MEALNDIINSTGLYYYITMKDFERNEGQKRSKKKLTKLSSKQKQDVSQKAQTLNAVLDFKSLQRKIIMQNVQINNYDELFEFFSKINLLELLRDPVEADIYFPCCFYEGNQAWISLGESGHYRYFSKNNELNSDVVGLDFVDILEIYYGLPTRQTIERAIRDFKIKFMEGQWVQQQNKKYMTNFTVIHNVDKYIKPNYPELHECIKDHLKVLETINVIGNINIKKREFSHENDNVFFSSNSYIANFVKSYSSSSINKLLNMFAVLGLINKIPEQNVPLQLLRESKLIADKRNLGNIISYYTVPNLLDVLPSANERAAVMLEHNIRYTNISKDKVQFVFGKGIANATYVQGIQKNKVAHAIVPLNFLHYGLEVNLMKLIEKKKYATKVSLAKVNIPHTTYEQRTKEIDRIWKSLIIKNNLMYIKPSDNMKKLLKLRTSEYIAIKKSNEGECIFD